MHSSSGPQRGIEGAGDRSLEAEPPASPRGAMPAPRRDGRPLQAAQRRAPRVRAAGCRATTCAPSLACATSFPTRREYPRLRPCGMPPLPFRAGGHRSAARDDARAREFPPSARSSPAGCFGTAEEHTSEEGTAQRERTPKPKLRGACLERRRPPGVCVPWCSLAGAFAVLACPAKSRSSPWGLGRRRGYGSVVRGATSSDRDRGGLAPGAQTVGLAPSACPGELAARRTLGP
jgi:hypothetical protein